MSFFNIKFKYNLIDKLSDIWNIKSGKIFQLKHGGIKKCYRAHTLFSWIYNFFGQSFVLPIAIFLVIVINFNLFGSLIFNVLASLLVYLIVEVLLIAVVPVIEIDCLEKKIRDKEHLEALKR
jgi:hypothetical protein